ncbi:MAG: putative methylamine utilization protein MauG [Phycisphaerales bacterium]|nr:putative methylamine utilization protein MauG [Phycisphaerales bacterium]
MDFSTSRKALLYCAMGGLLVGGLLLISSPPVRSAEPANPPTVNQAPVTLNALGKEILRVETEIDTIFAATLKQVPTIPNDQGHRLQQIQTLGKLMLYDKQLSVNRNTACTFCHMAETGFTGPISILNATTVSYPGSVRDANATQNSHTRYGRRKPQSYTYAPFYPVLRYDQTLNDFYGGNFWDLRATGARLQNPSAEQAQDPPLDPNEHGLIDSAVVVYLLSKSPYRPFFETVWGPQAFDIRWPANIEQLSRTPGPPPANDPLPVHLSPKDRGRSNATYDEFGLSVSAYESGPAISPFTSKFDFALANPTKQVLSADEQAGWALFRTKGKCNTCHLDGTASGTGTITPANAANVRPLFTDFTSGNLGVPKNMAIPFYRENVPDQFGFVPNPAGINFIDKGFGDFLRSATNPNATWAPLAPQFDGKVQVATLRNVDKRPSPDFVKAYMHNGYLKSLKEVVHFYYTRDKVPHKPSGLPGEKVTYWPLPEVTANEDMTIGNLGLTDNEENQIVAFLQTLTDGFQPPAAK